MLSELMLGPFSSFGRPKINFSRFKSEKVLCVLVNDLSPRFKTFELVELVSGVLGRFFLLYGVGALTYLVGALR